ncbi:MAG: GtrA family protein [Clostridia bacterium]|nr:GtrA family protein [Clostridia bacterium]
MEESEKEIETEVQTEVQAETAEQTEEQQAEKPAMTKKQQFIQLLKFTAFMASAGIIQFASITLLYDVWFKPMNYYGMGEDNAYVVAFIIGLTLSVIWSFTFNRKFTFKDAHNLKLAMGLVILYNCLIVVPLSLGGRELIKIWGAAYDMVITVISLLVNFVTEYFWDKFVVFNKKSNDKILSLFKKREDK